MIQPGHGQGSATPMKSLEGQVAIVTGSSRGVGRAVALQLAKAGADIVINFLRSRDAADETAAEISALGRRVAEVCADVKEPDDLASMMEWVHEAFGRLDIVVSSSLSSEPEPLLSATAEEIDAQIHSGIRPLILMTQQARKIRQSATPLRVIALSTVNSPCPKRGHLAVDETVRRLSEEAAPHGILINGVQAIVPENGEDNWIQSVAEVVQFLASPASNGIRGQTLRVESAYRPVAA